MRPETKARYPKDWDKISIRVRLERGRRCEGCGQVGNTKHNVLTVHHFDGCPENCQDSNLIVLCQKCHLRLQQGVMPSLLQQRHGQLRLPLFSQIAP